MGESGVELGGKLCGMRWRSGVWYEVRGGEEVAWD